MVSDETVAIADQIERAADLAALVLSFRGYVAIVFPVGPENGCQVRETAVERRFRDAYRSWYEVSITAICPHLPVESYKVWFLCSKRNGLACSLVPEPADQHEMKP